VPKIYERVKVAQIIYPDFDNLKIKKNNFKKGKEKKILTKYCRTKCNIVM